VQLGTEHVVGPTKGREARSVPVPGFVLDALSAQCQGRSPSELVFGGGGAYLPRSKSDGGLFASAVIRSGVQPITVHDLRHSCASLAVSAGVNVLALARMLGHKDPSVTLRVYADLFDSDLDAVAATLHTTYSPAEIAGNVLNMCSPGNREGLRAV
jgi:integrase